MTPRGFQKTYPPEIVARVGQLYVDEGWTQRAVASELGIAPSAVVKIMRRNGIPARTAAPRGGGGPGHHFWRDDSQNYSTLHGRVVAARGRPVGCTKCGLDDPDQRYEWANLTGDYRDVQDYARMCVTCHRRFDSGRRQQTGSNTSPFTSGRTSG